MRRALADLVGRLAIRLAPPALRDWAWALRHEADAIPHDGPALVFAIRGLLGLLPTILAARGRRFFSGETNDMIDSRRLGAVCAVAGVALGLGYLAAAGAPVRYLALNLAALAIGLALLAPAARARMGEGAVVAMAVALAAATLAGDAVDGAVRWLRLGGVAVQPSLILLPAMIALYARHRTPLAGAAMIAAAGVLAMQPDRAMAGMLALSLAAVALVARDRRTLVPLGAAAAGFAVTLARPDDLPAVPYVDRILFTAFDLHPLAGAAVLGGSALLLLPAAVGWRAGDERTVHAAFGAMWLAGIAAAALGNYPTPVVGYGGSAIIGYLLSLACLPRVVATAGGLSGAAARAATRGEGLLRLSVR